MSETLPLNVRERGYSEVETSVWKALSADSMFWRLVRRKILSITQTGRDSVRLEAGPYVGRAVIGGRVLTVTEKVEGALAASLRYAGRGSFRVERVTAPTTDFGDMAELLVEEFLAAVRDYATQGREFRYVSQRCVGSLVGGRIDVTKTVSLRARGLAHLIAFDRSVITRNTPKNRLLAAALIEAERLAVAVEAKRDTLSTARALSMLFGDCRDGEAIFGERTILADKAARLAEAATDAVEQDLLALTSVILAGASLEHHLPVQGAAPRTWFVKLEDLFERAIRETFKRVVPRLRITKGRGMERRIFAAESHRYEADPDLVFSDEDGVRVVGDVKYKDLDSGYVAPADLYQLLVHAAAFECDAAFLVFPGDTYAVRDLGIASTGCRTHVFTIDVRDTEGQLSKAAAELGLIS